MGFSSGKPQRAVVAYDDAPNAYDPPSLHLPIRSSEPSPAGETPSPSDPVNLGVSFNEG